MASNNVSKYNFIEEPDSAIECVICLDVAEDPRQHEECGRLLCKECLEKWRSMGETNHVPTAGGNSLSTSRITEVSSKY